MSERLPASMRIKLRYPDVDTFIQRYAVNISRGGVFIATRTPKAVGTQVRFEFQLATGAPVIRGEGQVIWVKDYDPEQPRRVHGMGVRFTRLDAESRQMLERTLAWKREHHSEGAVEEAQTPSGEEGWEEGAQQLGAGPVGDVAEPPPAVDPALEAPTTLSLPPTVVSLPPEPPVEVIAAPVPGEPTPVTPLIPETDERVAVAELWQATQSQVVRAARAIAEMTVASHYYPEDVELAALLQPLRIPMPPSGRDAARLLAALLEGRGDGSA